MKALASLCFQPVSCVLTSAQVLSAQVQVFEINTQNSRITCVEGIESCYSMVMGSAVLVGEVPQSQCNIDSAVIVELPHGRVRATGNSEWRRLGEDIFEVVFEGVTDTGLTLSMHLYCGAEVSESAIDRFVAAKANCN